MTEEKSDQQPTTMHFCKVCNKGFSCGGALGGHMRAHGSEEHSPHEFQDKAEGNKRTYNLRTTTNRFVSHRTREDNYVKDFLNGKYSQGDPGSPSVSFNNSSLKGKYHKTCASKEEKELANCLVMLSNGEPNRADSTIGNSFTSASIKEDKAKEGLKGRFQCKNCKKVFNSHQALGGHRASHKKVKGCFAARLNSIEDDNDVEDDPTFPAIDLNHTSESPVISLSKKKSKEHKCSICHRVFTSGQALGGHKRCHWLTSNIQDTFSTSMFCGSHYEREHVFGKYVFEDSEPLDLNIPTPLNDNPSKFQGLTRIYLPSREREEISGINQESYDSLLDGNISEEHCKVKIAKLSGLRERNLDGEECSTWLQVGIAPATGGGTAL